MGMNLKSANELQKGLGHAASAMLHDLDLQCLRVLRCTARAMASSPGGLRFKAGTRPWLEGLDGGRPASCATNRPRANALLRLAE